MAFPKVTTRINLRSVLSVEELERLNPDRVLRSLQQSILKRLRQGILAAPLTPRARAALYHGMKVKVGPRSITVVATHPAFKPLLQGQRAGQMKWLLKARGPIPIVTDEGEVIFRNATPRSMDNGSWYHPGRAPTDVIEKAKADAKESVKKRVAQDLKAQVRAALQRASK